MRDRAARLTKQTRLTSLEWSPGWRQGEGSLEHASENLRWTNTLMIPRLTSTWALQTQHSAVVGVCNWHVDPRFHGQVNVRRKTRFKISSMSKHAWEERKPGQWRAPKPRRFEETFCDMSITHSETGQMCFSIRLTCDGEKTARRAGSRGIF